jgi:GT2 family glycosyltransferase
MAKIGLVTVLYKSDEVLEGFLRTVSYQDHKDYVLYLVDNSASEKTTALLNNLILKYPVTSYRHMDSGGNIGVAAGNNLGIKAALADNCTDIILLNNDIEIEQQYVFSKMLSVSNEMKEPIVVPKILYYDNRKVWMAGGNMDNIRALGIHYHGDDENDVQFSKAKHITYAPTCFMLIKTEVFEKIGIMDEKYFAYYDDTDFVYRACKYGYKMYYEPSLTILHKVSSSSGGDNSPFYIYYGNRNKIYFIRKNYSGLRKCFAIFYTLVSRVVFYLKFDKERKSKLLQAVKDGFKIPVDN